MNTRTEPEVLVDLLLIYERAAEKRHRENGELVNHDEEHEAGVQAVYLAATTDWLASVRRPLAKGGT